MSKAMPVRRDGNDVMMETWAFLLLVGLVLLLVLLLWSAQRGRKVHLTFGKIDTLREALPSIAGATHGALMAGNKVELLQNGDGFFPPLLAAIGAAEETVHLESYVWWKGKICEQVAEALAEKAREGVEVRVLLDASGSSRMDDELLERMRESGVKVSKYRPARFSNLARVDSRDHRKIVVVDGRIGFVFGHGSLGIVDAAIASELRQAFLDDQKDCREITLRDWQGEPWTHRLRDALSWRLNELL